MYKIIYNVKAYRMLGNNIKLFKYNYLRLVYDQFLMSFQLQYLCQTKTALGCKKALPSKVESLI